MYPAPRSYSSVCNRPGLVCGLLILVASACGDVLTPIPGDPASREVLGLVEVTITGLGTGHVQTHARTARDAAGLTVTGVAGAAGAQFALSAPENLDAGGDGTIQLSPLAGGSFTDGARGAGGFRYVYATYLVRNAQSDGTPYDTPRQNLTFLAVDTDGTIDETAVSQLSRFDASAANPAIAPGMLPTGSVTRDPNGIVHPGGADVLQVLTESEVAAVLAGAPAGVHTVFPYGYVVRNAVTPSTRSLPDNPATGQFDGVVTFAFRVPLQATPAEDPFSISVVFLAMDDTDTRVTESLEEQGTSSVAAGAGVLGSGAGVTLLGNSVTSVSNHGVRRVCRVRTAGTNPNAPVATLVDATGCTAGPVSIPSTVVVVDRSVGGGDGRSWANAFTHLQDALACVRDDTGPGEACEGVNEIWVAAGVYYPDEGVGQTDDAPSSRYELVEGVGLYGGFGGGEYVRSQRDWAANLSQLDGDIDQNPATTISNDARNILYVDASAGTGISRATVVDGFIVVRAQGAGLWCAADGAGSECSPMVRNMVFTNNVLVWAQSGGAATLRADNGGTVSPLLIDVAFNNNAALANKGGAVSISASTGSVAHPVLVRVSFDGNHAGDLGGAIYLAESSGASIELRVYNGIFRNNTASFVGGALRLHGGTSVWMTNVEFWNNDAPDGGAISVGVGSSVTLIGATLAGNTASDSGSAIHGDAGGTVDLSNVLVWGNVGVGAQILDLLGTAQSSLLAGGCPATFSTCTGVVDLNPQFVDIGNGDLQLDGSSPAVDAGDNIGLPLDLFDLDGDGDTTELIPVDLAGQLRLFDWGGDDGTAIVDLGAHERR